jgi:hypothetical protein
LIENGIGFRPFLKIVHSGQAVSVSLVASWEGSCCIDGYFFEWGPNVVLMHLAPIPGLEAAIGCTGVTLLAPLACIISCLEPVVSLLDLIQFLIDTQMTT